MIVPGTEHETPDIQLSNQRAETAANPIPPGWGVKRRRWAVPMILVTALFPLGLGWKMLMRDGPTASDALVYYTVRRGELPISVTERGNLESKNILELKGRLEEREALVEARRELFEARETRIHPGRDEQGAHLLEWVDAGCFRRGRAGAGTGRLQRGR